MCEKIDDKKEAMHIIPLETSKKLSRDPSVVGWPICLLSRKRIMTFDVHDGTTLSNVMESSSTTPGASSGDLPSRLLTACDHTIVSKKK